MQSARTKMGSKYTTAEHADPNRKPKGQPSSSNSPNLMNPSKRQRVYIHQESSTTASNPSSPEKRSASSSTADIWKWTLSRDAIAPCFVKDIFDMRENEVKDMEFWWLGRVPCRTVVIVGLVVGVQVYEKRTVYSVDDGTAVIDCFHRHSTPSCASPSKPPLRNRATTIKPLALPEAPPPPIAQVGTSVRLIGRIVKKFERQIAIDEIAPCKSPNEEPHHWLAVLDLHRSRYFADDLGPFIVPVPTSASTYPITLDHSVVSEVTESIESQKEQSTRIEVTSPASVASVATPSSVASSSRSHVQSPPRLRHPSRLHSRDLTANTFRIYLKHYMDHVPSSSACPDRAASPTPLSGRCAKVLTTNDLNMILPRSSGSSKRKSMHRDTDSTPRASRSERLQTHEDAERTPTHQRTLPSVSLPSEAVVDDETEAAQTLGFTLSHLRRVPELAILAQRVVDAEAKRRAREERKRAETQPGSSSARTKPSRNLREGESMGRKMKRLFQFAIRQLFEEGDVVLWDGPVRDAWPSDELSALWKMGVTQDASQEYCDEAVELSEPEDDEESYITLRPEHFLDVVEGAIRVLASRAKSAVASSSLPTVHDGIHPKASTSTASRTFALHQRLRAQDRGPAPPPGPTPTEILTWLRRDDRWARVGEWAVKEALEYGRKEGRVWCVGDGRWEGCW